MVVSNNIFNRLNKPFLVLAPMAGYTNSTFRQICKIYGADMVYSEMANATALAHNGKKTLELLQFQKIERPYIVQLFGNDPKYFYQAAKVVTEQINPDGIDLNLGCPAKKVFTSGSGAALFYDQDRALRVIEETLRGTHLPVSIKIRTKVKNRTAYRFMKKIKDYPLAAVMIHGRSYKQGFVGAIDYKNIKRIKQLVNFPVIANGGINTPEEAGIMLSKTLADGLGVARGSLKNPWLFLQIKQYLQTGVYQDFSLNDIKKLALLHAELAEKSMGQHGFLEIRKYLLWYFRGFDQAKNVRKQLTQVQNMQDVLSVLDVL